LKTALQCICVNESTTHDLGYTTKDQGPIHEFFKRYQPALDTDEIPEVVTLVKTIASDRNEVQNIVSEYEEKFSKDPGAFWALFSEIPPLGDPILQLLGIIQHHTTSSPVARMILSRRLSQEVTTRAGKLREQKVQLTQGISYRDLAFRLSITQDLERSKRTLREGDSFSVLKPGVFPCIKTTNWRRFVHGILWSYTC
jgi:hypothetical protein